jgi:hypothetical protein
LSEGKSFALAMRLAGDHAFFVLLISGAFGGNVGQAIIAPHKPLSFTISLGQRNRAATSSE